MDWIKELKEWVGVTDEGYAFDLNDANGREILTAEHLDRIRETTANMDVVTSDSTV